MARARLGMAFQDLRGRMGSEVLTSVRGGLAVKGLPKYKYPKVEAVESGNARFREATLVWNGMSMAQADAWKAYAATLTKSDPVTLTQYSPLAKNVFIGLATKFRQASPVGAIPVWPPDAGFMGESILLDVSGDLGNESGNSDFGLRKRREVKEVDRNRKGSMVAKGEGKDSMAAASAIRNPQSAIHPLSSSIAIFTASAPNSPDVVTEILGQRLLNVHRSPTKFYKSMLFHAFEAGGLALEVPLAPGIYAFAYRFVEVSTGQMSEMLVLPRMII